MMNHHAARSSHVAAPGGVHRRSISRATNRPARSRRSETTSRADRPGSSTHVGNPIARHMSWYSDCSGRAKCPALRVAPDRGMSRGRPAEGGSRRGAFAAQGAEHRCHGRGDEERWNDRRLAGRQRRSDPAESQGCAGRRSEQFLRDAVRAMRRLHLEDATALSTNQLRLPLRWTPTTAPAQPEQAGRRCPARTLAPPARSAPSDVSRRP